MDIRLTFRRAKWFIQRGRRGWADCDIWDFDSYLCGVIAAGLERLKEECQGCPVEFWDEDAAGDECHKWRQVLETMIQGFKAHQLSLEETDRDRIAELEKTAEEGMDLFTKYMGYLWD